MEIAEVFVPSCRHSRAIVGRSTRFRAAFVFALAISTTTEPARADPSWRAGLDLHSIDAAFGARRPLGIAFGIRTGAVEGAVVVDPMIFVLGWEMLDVTIGRRVAGDRVVVLAGWRQTSGLLGGGRRYDEALLLGADWLMPASGRLRVAFGLELETSVWRHGGHIDSEYIRISADADLATRLELLLHARFELTGIR